jgi:hypothetical protein
MAGSAPCTGGGWPHLHDRGLNKAQPDHIPAHATHGDSVADIEVLAAQNDKISRDGCYHLLQSKRQSGSHQTQSGRQASRVVEPDGKYA